MDPAGRVAAAHFPADPTSHVGNTGSRRRIWGGCGGSLVVRGGRGGVGRMLKRVAERVGGQRGVTRRCGVVTVHRCEHLACAAGLCANGPLCVVPHAIQADTATARVPGRHECCTRQIRGGTSALAATCPSPGTLQTLCWPLRKPIAHQEATPCVRARCRPSRGHSPRQPLEQRIMTRRTHSTALPCVA
eukprot:COSAG02_NODE_4953_length_4768_cov_11.582338_2_plen_189_part_00